MKIKKNGSVINLSELDLRKIINKTLNEQVNLTKLDNGVEISEEYIEEYKKVKLEISGDRKKVKQLRKNLKLNGCIITGNPSSSLGNNGMTTFVSDYLIPTDLDYKNI